MKRPEHTEELSRRDFISLGIQGTAGLGLAQVLGTTQLLAGCAPGGRTTVHGACYHDCPDTCSWTVTAVNGEITEFGPSRSHPYTAGKLCSKMDNFPADVTFHPDRILTPLKRIGRKGSGEFEAVSWDEAIRAVAGRLKTIIAETGGEAVLPYSFAGTQGIVQQNALGSRFFSHLGATRLERTICGDAAYAGVVSTNGDALGVLPEDIVHSRFIVLWGTNTVTSNQHLWPFVSRARERGAHVVVVDPFQSHTALLADRHIQPMPGTDAALALGLVHIILAENLQDQDYVDRYTTGLAELRAHVAQYDPASVAAITGIEESELIAFARDYAGASPSLIRVLIGMEHQANGASAFRAVAMLPALTGAWRHHGGGLMHYTFEFFGQALNWDRVELGGRQEDPETRIVNMAQIGRALTDRGWDPPIRALFVYNSNPAVIAPNQNLVLEGLARDDLFTVVLEHFMTDTARYADFVFPATSQLEHWDLMPSWGQVYLSLNQPVIPPRGEARSNSDFFRTLARAMDFAGEQFDESDLDIIRATLDSDHAYLQGITFERLKSDGWARLNIPEPWMPHADGNFATPSGKCQFYVPRSPDESVPAFPEYRPVQYADDYLAAWPLRLLAIKSTRNFLNSSHANVRRLRVDEGSPVLDMHPLDANTRGIVDGDEVVVFNPRGEVRLSAKVSAKVRPGVVSMPQGHWPSLMNGGSSANALTDDRLTDMGGGAALQESRVQVRKA